MAQSTWSGGDMVGLGDGDGAVAVGTVVGAGAARLSVGLGDDDTVATGAAVGAGAARHASTASVVAEACKQGTFAAKSTSSVGGAAAS